MARPKPSAETQPAKPRRHTGRYIEHGVDITISTRHPDKWRFVDIETNQVWRFDPDAKGKQFKIAGVAVVRLGACSNSEKSQTMFLDTVPSAALPPAGKATPLRDRYRS